MSAPTEVTHDQTSITLQWTAPVSNGASPVTKYVLFAKADYESSFKEVYAGMTLSYKVPGLRTGFFHQFKIQSVNIMGNSELSPTSASILTALIPAVPTSLTLEKRNKFEMTFKWEPPVDKGGLELLSYKIYMAEESEVYSKVLDAPSELNPSITVHTEQGLQADKTYKFKVSAVNFVGEGPITDEIFVIAADMPEKPENPPTITLVTQTSITLTLTELPVENNGGSPVTGYIVQMDDGLGGNFMTVHNSLYLDLILSGLESSRFYRIRYAARNIIYDSGNLFECDEL